MCVYIYSTTLWTVVKQADSQPTPNPNFANGPRPLLDDIRAQRNQLPHTAAARI